MEITIKSMFLLKYSEEIVQVWIVQVRLIQESNENVDQLFSTFF